MEMVRLTIDGQEVFAVENSTILQAAKSVGVRIPTLCFHDKLKPIGACRLCVVEVDGSHEAVTACDTQVKEGISVRTQTEALMRLRRDALKLILANHPLDCPICAKAGECMLQDLVYELGVTEVDYRFPPAELTDEEYPLVLSTGRRLYHYHSRTQTGRCAGLNDLLGEERADISIEDAKAMGISDREMIRVASRRGEIMVQAHVTPEVPKGLVWMAFHFREGNANWLTNSASDPDTLTAEFKACAVKVSKMERHP